MKTPQDRENQNSQKETNEQPITFPHDKFEGAFQKADALFELLIIALDYSQKSDVHPVLSGAQCAGVSRLIDDWRETMENLNSNAWMVTHEEHDFLVKCRIHSSEIMRAVRGGRGADIPANVVKFAEEVDRLPR